MTQQTSMILKGLLASTGLLVGSGAFATSIANDDAKNGFLHDGFGKSYGVRFSKADVAKAITAFNVCISAISLPTASPPQSTGTPSATDPIYIATKPAEPEYNPFDAPKAATPTPAPEPATLALFGLGLTGMGLAKRARRKDKK